MTTPTARRSCRWRAVAAASLDALDWKQSPREREVAEHRSQRTYTGGRRVAPSTIISFHQNFRSQPDPPSHGIWGGKSDKVAPQGCECEGGSRSTTELHRSTADEGEDCHQQTPTDNISASKTPPAGTKPTPTLYTSLDRSVDSPTSRHRSGRQKWRNPRIDGERGGETRVGPKVTFLLLWTGERGRPRSV